jgi:hypothetical protein
MIISEVIHSVKHFRLVYFSLELEFLLIALLSKFDSQVIFQENIRKHKTICPASSQYFAGHHPNSLEKD